LRWKGHAIFDEKIIMRFATESKMKMWYEELERVRKMRALILEKRLTSGFEWMRTMPNANP
jgi:hypothetical protein